MENLTIEGVGFLREWQMELVKMLLVLSCKQAIVPPK